MLLPKFDEYFIVNEFNKLPDSYFDICPNFYTTLTFCLLFMFVYSEANDMMAIPEIPFQKEILNYIPHAVIATAVLVFIILAFFSQRKTWIWVEIISALVFGGVFLVFPDHALRIQTTSEPNDKMLFVARFYGAMLLSTGVTFYRSSETRDATVPITLMMSRVCMGSTLLMAQLFTYFTSATKAAKATSEGATTSRDAPMSPWSNLFLPMFVLPTGLWMLGNLIHLLRSRDFNTYPQHNTRLNNHLRIDAWLMLLAGVMMLAFPRQILNALFSSTAVPKEVTLHIMRSCGAVCLCEAVISLQAPGFLHNRDKLVLFGTRIISTLFAAGLLCAGHLLFGLLSLDRLYYSLPLLLLIFLNAFIGLVTDGTTIYVVPTPTKPARKTYDPLIAGDGKKLE